MKLPRLRRKPAPATTEPASVSPADAAGPVLQVLIYASSGLPEQEFSAQTEKLRRVASYDPGTRSWYTWIPLGQPGQVAEMLTVLFEAARVHGTTVRVRIQPAGESSPPGPVP